MISEERMHFDKMAPAPPTAAKYTDWLRVMASMTAWDLFPFPIMAPMPMSKSLGVYLSIRLAVVGPADPMGRPSLAGDGPI